MTNMSTREICMGKCPPSCETLYCVDIGLLEYFIYVLFFSCNSIQVLFSLLLSYILILTVWHLEGKVRGSCLFCYYFLPVMECSNDPKLFKLQLSNIQI